jgi:hypothetical protein
MSQLGIQRFDGEFATFVRKQLDELCTEFINGVPYEMANRIQKEYPDLAHSNIMDAISRIARPSDGAEEKSLEWFETSERNISCEFEEEFPDEDDFYDEDDDWDEDDNSDEYVARVEQVEQEGMSEAEKQRMRQSYEVAKSLEERRPDIYTRYIRWLFSDNGDYDEFVYFSSKGSQPGEEYSGENDPDDELIHFYGLDPKDAVPGYTNGEWVIVRY